MSRGRAAHGPGLAQWGVRSRAGPTTGAAPAASSYTTTADVDGDGAKDRVTITSGSKTTRVTVRLATGRTVSTGHTHGPVLARARTQYVGAAHISAWSSMGYRRERLSNGTIRVHASVGIVPRPGDSFRQRDCCADG